MCCFGVSVWDAVCDVCQFGTFEQNCLSFVGVSFVDENGYTVNAKIICKMKTGPIRNQNLISNARCSG